MDFNDGKTKAQDEVEIEQAVKNLQSETNDNTEIKIPTTSQKDSEATQVNKNQTASDLLKNIVIERFQGNKSASSGKSCFYSFGIHDGFHKVLPNHGSLSLPKTSEIISTGVKEFTPQNFYMSQRMPYFEPAFRTEIPVLRHQISGLPQMTLQWPSKMSSEQVGGTKVSRQPSNDNTTAQTVAGKQTNLAKRHKPSPDIMPGTGVKYKTPGQHFRNKNGQIKRPMNAFMIWARSHRRPLCEKMPRASNAEVSMRLGEIWASLPAEEKQQYYREAERIKKQHSIDFPGWVYKPQKKTKEKDQHNLLWAKYTKPLVPDQPSTQIVWCSPPKPVVNSGSRSGMGSIPPSGNVGLAPVQAPVLAEMPRMSVPLPPQSHIRADAQNNVGNVPNWPMPSERKVILTDNGGCNTVFAKAPRGRPPSVTRRISVDDKLAMTLSKQMPKQDEKKLVALPTKTNIMQSQQRLDSKTAVAPNASQMPPKKTMQQSALLTESDFMAKAPGRSQPIVSEEFWTFPVTPLDQRIAQSDMLFGEALDYNQGFVNPQFFDPYGAFSYTPDPDFGQNKGNMLQLDVHGWKDYLQDKEKASSSLSFLTTDESISVAETMPATVMASNSTELEKSTGKSAECEFASTLTNAMNVLDDNECNHNAEDSGAAEDADDSDASDRVEGSLPLKKRTERFLRDANSDDKNLNDAQGFNYDITNDVDDSSCELHPLTIDYTVDETAAEHGFLSPSNTLEDMKVLKTIPLEAGGGDISFSATQLKDAPQFNIGEGDGKCISTLNTKENSTDVD